MLPNALKVFPLTDNLVNYFGKVLMTDLRHLGKEELLTLFLDSTRTDRLVNIE